MKKQVQAQSGAITSEDFTFTSEDYNMNAVRLDSNKEFSDFQTGEIKGEVLIKDE